MYVFSRNLGIDLGTANVLIYAEGKGIILREPAVVAVDQNDGKVIRVGAEARNMLGRTPGNVEIVRPLRRGVITDYDMTERLLASLLRKAVGYTLVKPRVVITVPSDVSEVEERAVIQAAMEAGARHVYLMEKPLAAAYGAKLNLSDPKGSMLVNIGGGVTDMAVLCMNGIASSASVTVGGDSFDDALIAYIRKHHGILIGTAAAENVKISIGTVVEQSPERSMQIKGRDLKTGLPREAEISSGELVEVYKKPLRLLLEAILDILEKTSPELVADLSETGILLTGGGSRLFGIADAIAQRTHLSCRVAEDPEICAAMGCGKSLAWIKTMQEGPINLARKKLMREN